MKLNSYIFVDETTLLNFTVKDLPQDNHVFTVKSVDQSNNISDASNEVIFDNLPPEQPVLSVTFSSVNKVTLKILPSASTDILNYKLYRDGVLKATLSKNNPTWADITIMAGTEYEYYVQAFDESGNTSLSNTVKISTLIDEISPAITSIQPHGGFYSGNADIRVTASDNASIKSVILEYSVDDKKTWNDLGEKSVANPNTSVSGVATYTINTKDFSDGLFYMRAKAIDSSNNISDYSGVYDFMIDNTAPEAPLNIRTHQNESLIEIRFDAPLNDIISHFEMHRAVDDGTFVSVATLNTLNYFDKYTELNTNYS